MTPDQENSFLTYMKRIAEALEELVRIAESKKRPRPSKNKK